MATDNYKSVMANASFGYSFQEIIFDRDGNPIDLKVIEINRAFEKLTGIEAKNLVGQKLSQIAFKYDLNNTNIILKDIGKMLSGENIEFEFFGKFTHIWMKVVFNLVDN